MCGPPERDYDPKIDGPKSNIDWGWCWIFWTFGAVFGMGVTMAFR